MMYGWRGLACDGISFALKVTHFNTNAPENCGETQADCDGEYRIVNGSAVWRCSLRLRQSGCGVLDGEAAFSLAEGIEPCGNIAIALSFSRWSENNYVLMPAAAYNGNRFRSVPAPYPPFLHDEDGIGPNMPVTITDVPRLNDGCGPSEIHLRSGDMATPAVGVWVPAANRGFLLLCEHITSFGYTGIKLTESEDRASATLQLEAPAVRQRKYTPNAMGPSDDTGAAFACGDTVTLRFRIVLFGCADIPALYKAFLHHRKDVCGSRRLVHGLPLSAAYRIIERKFNESQFNEDYGYYMLSPGGQSWTFGDWQAGWCGGGLSSLALLYDGNAQSRERANRTMDAVFGALQNENGFILPILSGGKELGDDFCHQDSKGVLLIRKDADVLVFAARHILLTQQRGEAAPQRWLIGLKALADAFVRLWARHGQFGQFIDIDTEEMLIGGTAAGSMAPGGLALAWKVLGDREYLRVAEESARYFHRDFVRNGLMNGGPGEILQNPDSESASNMLESFMALYDLTGSREWLPMAEDTARQCASWCVSYDFNFPAESVFGRLGMRTLGSVYANVQNKHSAPGFCTLSGASLLRLYRATGDRHYLELCRETAHNITQYLSRADRPIPSWDGKELPPGWMCERVNLCDWEGKQNIGGVFCGSCWCEVSCLLTYAEIPGIWFLTDSGEAVAIDHVEVSVTDEGDAWRLLITNPTDFPADVKLLAEHRSNLDTPWDQCVGGRCAVVPVREHGSAVVSIKKKR